MNQLIIIKTENAEKIKNFLDQEKENYKVFNEAKRKKDLFVDYAEALKDKQRNKEVALWDQAQQEEDQESKDWEWK